MRVKPALGLALVALGGLLVLFAPAAPIDEPLEPASVGDARATDAPPGDEPRPSLVAMGLGAFVGLLGLALLARSMEPRDLE